MILRRLLAPLSLLFVLSVTWEVAGDEAAPSRTALDDYVEAPDDHFAWKLVSSSQFPGGKAYVIDMTSQRWRTADEVDRPVWQHWVTVAVPDDLRTSTGFMYVGGGGNGGDPPSGPNEMIQKIALATGSVAAEVRMIPNQRLEFHGDGQLRSEDDLVAYTWVKFLETGDTTWPARNPMVKSVVRAMDVVSELMDSDVAGPRRIDEYVVAGGSKRGWTTWLVGAVDDRVAGIAPIVIDILNLEKSMGHHFAAYGFFAPSLGDYVEHKLVQHPDHPRLPELFALVDPYHYRHRLTMPKFIMNAAGDQFFTPDMSRHYFADLEGEKYLRYVPNADHSLDDTDAVESIVAFFSLVAAGKEGPQFSWTQPDDNTLRVTTVDSPVEVKLWQASNPKARDFRMESLGPKYSSEVLTADDEGNYVAHVPDPANGYTAFFIELTFDVGASIPFKATTNVAIVPDVLPFADKDPTLPTSLTLRCTAPSREAVALVEAAFRTPEMQAVAEDPRVSVDGEEGVLALTVNWVPKGRLEDGARAVAGGLTALGCEDFAFQMESGRPD